MVVVVEAGRKCYFLVARHIEPKFLIEWNIRPKEAARKKIACERVGEREVVEEGGYI